MKPLDVRMFWLAPRDSPATISWPPSRKVVPNPVVMSGMNAAYELRSAAPARFRAERDCWNVGLFRRAMLIASFSDSTAGAADESRVCASAGPAAMSARSAQAANRMENGSLDRRLAGRTADVSEQFHGAGNEKRSAWSGAFRPADPGFNAAARPAAPQRLATESRPGVLGPRCPSIPRGRLRPDPRW